MKHFRLPLMATACASTGLLLSLPALAGSKFDAPVLIDTASRFAAGQLGSARNSSDSVQYIGCDIWTAIGACYAVNTSGVSVSCSTSNANLMANMRSLNGDSLLIFYWDAFGVCTQVIVGHNSSYMPKLP